MTAFARKEIQSEHGSLVWEIRSVNHRYLEASLRLEENFRPLEMQLRKLITDKLGRGKIDAVLRYQAPESHNTALEFDQDLAKSVIKSCDEMATMANQPAPIDMLAILKWPGVLKTETLDQKALNSSTKELFLLALDELIATRETEGTALKGMVEQRCDEIRRIAEVTQQRMPEVLTIQRKRLLNRVEELQMNLDPERLEQEMVILAQKSDVAEELDRLQNHVTEVLAVLKRDEPVGRRLDFLMQELNREANTLASKSIDADVTKMSVELKVLIEQMREQIQNIE